MTARTAVYQALANDTDPEYRALIGEDNPRVFAKKSMTSSIEGTPYLVYKMGNSSAELLSEERDAERQFFQVWVHDFHDGETADYMRIDEVVKHVKRILTKLNGQGIWTVTFLETSQDLNDETLNTLFRYLRFQMIKEGV